MHHKTHSLTIARVCTLFLYSLAVVGVGGLCAYGWYGVTANRAQTMQEESEQRAREIVATIPVWHKKISTQQTVRVGVITDTHIHASRLSRDDKRADAPRRLKSADTAVFQRFTSHARTQQADFLVHIGDVIEGTGEENAAGIVMIDAVVTAMKRAELPIYWSIGNHDLRAVTKEQFRTAVGQEALNTAWDVGDYRFIVLDLNEDASLEEIAEDAAEIDEVDEASETDPESGDDPNEDGALPAGTMQWLRDQLATDKRVFVFCHYPFDTEVIVSADGMPKKTLPFAAQMRALFEEYRVDGVFSGHVEAKAYTKEKWTHYYLLTGTKKSKTYPEGFYDLVITAGVPDLTMFYTDPHTGALRKDDFE